MNYFELKSVIDDVTFIFLFIVAIIRLNIVWSSVISRRLAQSSLEINKYEVTLRRMKYIAA